MVHRKVGVGVAVVLPRSTRRATLRGGLVLGSELEQSGSHQHGAALWDIRVQAG